MDIIRAMLYLIISLNKTRFEFQSFQLQYNEKQNPLYVYINQDAFNLLINQGKKITF